jgi:hypothetical protein
MFLGLLDPGPLVRGTDPDPSSQSKIVRKPLIPTCDFSLTFYLGKMM